MAVITRLHLLLATLAFLGACAGTPAPEVTEDGLVLKPDTGRATVHVRPGATIADYSEFGLEPCEVSFRRNWLRDQNSSRVNLSNRVTQRDVDRIRDNLAAECDKYFRAALTEEPAYPLVENFDNGEAVLVLRPAIIDLDVSAPDVQSSGMQRSYTTTAGEMTLLLELVDGTTGEVLARARERQESRDVGRMQWSNSVTNRAEADRILKSWATRLRTGLDAARQ
jgi:hypothetical protein